MRLEAIETTTLYLSLPAAEFAAISQAGWLEVPLFAHFLTLCVAPPEVHVKGTQPVVRAQVRTEYLSQFAAYLNSATHLQLNIPPDTIPDLNRNLVGPLTPIGDVPDPELEHSVTSTSAAHAPALILATP